MTLKKLVNIPSSLNILKTKLNDSDFGKLKKVPADLKKLSDTEDNGVVKNYKIQHTKDERKKFGKKNLNTATLIHINQYNTDKLNLIY